MWSLALDIPNRVATVRGRETWVLYEKGLGIGTFPFQDHMELQLIL